MKQIFTLGRRLVVLAGAAALACGSVQSLAQARKLAVQVGTPAPSVVSLQMYVAQQAGFFAENGLEVEVRYSSGAPQAVQLMAAGQADIALGTIEPLIIGYEKGVRGKAFVRLTNKMIYYVAVPADSKIQRIEELKGQNVGVANLGGAAVAMTRAILRTGGAESTTLLPVGIGEQAMTALRSDKVQALGLWSNAYYTLERNGNKFRYFTHPTLGNYGNVVMMTSDKTLAEKKAELCGFSRSIAKASLFIVENPSAALRMYWATVPGAKVGASEADTIRNGMVELAPQIQEFDIGFPPKTKYGVFDQALLTQYVGLLKDQGLTVATPASSDLVTDSMAGCMNDFDPAAVRAKAKNWKG
ncbi:MAG: ABC transporter substrate-binding protein [Burkholderiaceae bacterium]|nr:ABC transporter substrate-binding protein [Burkholderiaceae bacterium]